MSEIADIQKKINREAGLKQGGGGDILPLLKLCASAGLVIEKVAKNLDVSETPRELFLDLWQFALHAQKLEAWAKDEALSRKIIGGDEGDMGNKTKADMADLFAMLAETASGFRVNLRELASIGVKRTEERASLEVKQGEVEQEAREK